MNNLRNNYWSTLKGIAILAVVMIHIPLTDDANSMIATRQIINFPVAMFIFLSGYFAKQESNTWRSVKRLLLPYLIWSSFWCIIIPPHTLSTNTLIIKYLTGGFSILYFLFVLIQLKVLTPCLIKHITKEGYVLKKDPLWLITPIYLLFFSSIRLWVGG